MINKLKKSGAVTKQMGGECNRPETQGRLLQLFLDLKKQK